MELRKEQKKQEKFCCKNISPLPIEYRRLKEFSIPKKAIRSLGRNFFSFCDLQAYIIQPKANQRLQFVDMKRLIVTLSL